MFQQIVFLPEWKDQQFNDPKFMLCEVDSDELSFQMFVATRIQGKMTKKK